MVAEKYRGPLAPERPTDEPSMGIPDSKPSLSGIWMEGPKGKPQIGEGRWGKEGHGADLTHTPDLIELQIMTRSDEMDSQLLQYEMVSVLVQSTPWSCLLYSRYVTEMNLLAGKLPKAGCPKS